MVYQLTKADARPVRAADLRIAKPGTLACELPALSVSTLLLVP